MRLFIGLPVDSQTGNCLYTKGQHLLGPNEHLSVVPQALYHVTLTYLGERTAEQRLVLESILDQLAAQFSPFELCANGVYYFGKENNAIVYAKIADQPALTVLCASLRSRLTSVGENFEGKDFVPHITLARKAVLTSAIPHDFPEDIVFCVSQVVLYHSARIEGDLHYIPIYRVPLLQHEGGLFYEKGYDVSF